MQDFYFGSNSERRKLSSLGKIRSIYSGVYTSIFNDEELAETLRIQWPLIVAHAFKNCVIAYRTAIEFKPSPQSKIYLISGQSKTVEIGGIHFCLIRGKTYSTTNRKALMGAQLSSLERAYLDSLTVPRKPVGDDRYLPFAELENNLVELLDQNGEDSLNGFRDKARNISIELGMPAQFKKLDGIIGTLLGTRSADLKGSKSLARSKTYPIDTDKRDLFITLAGHLQTVYFPEKVDENLMDREYFENKAFFESYFSNYIEGTQFILDEAEEIIFDKKEIENRVNDSHDISGTFEIVSDRVFMTKSPESFTEFIDSLKNINRTILTTRNEMNPGEFKRKLNRAGNTLFVHPDYVLGTLEAAFQISRDLDNPLARGIFLSFAVSEIHPFTDGNGRTCRIVLNRELLSRRMYSIIIPTVFREDYLLALRALSRKKRPAPLVKMFLQSYRFSQLDFKDYQNARMEIEKRNWLLEPDEGKIIL